MAYTFGKKRDDTPPSFNMGATSGYPPLSGMSPGAYASGSPIDMVVQLKQQGMTNNQIVASLTREGLTSNQIFDAMNQVDMRTMMTPPGPQPMNRQPDMDPGMMDMGPQSRDTGPEQFQPDTSEPDQMMSPPSYPQERGMPPLRGAPGPSLIEAHDTTRQRIEELAEAIIDEKWTELLKNINRIIEWKNKIETRIQAIEQEYGDLQNAFGELHKAVLGKIGEYDQNINNVGTEIKAMEKVFQKVLPTFTDNVKELSRITKATRPGDQPQPPQRSSPTRA